MPVHRRKSTDMKRFLNIDMEVYLDALRHLSRAAVILWIVMLDNKNDWQFSATELQRRANISRQSYSTAINQLQDYGLVVKQSNTRKAGQFMAPVYDVYDAPQVVNSRAQKLGTVESTDTKGFVNEESHEAGILTVPSKPSPVNKPLTSTNKQSIITSNKRSTVDHADRMTISSSSQELKAKTNSKYYYPEVYEFAELALERTKTNRPHNLNRKDKELLTEYVNEFTTWTDETNAKRLVKLAFAELASRADVGYPMAYVRKILEALSNDQVATIQEACEQYQANSYSGVSLGRYLKISDIEEYGHDEYAVGTIEDLLDVDSNVFFYKQDDYQDEITGWSSSKPQEQTNQADDVEIDDDSDLPF